MFSKAIIFLLFAASTIAGPVPSGIYRFINAASRSPARVDYGGGPIYVSSYRPNGTDTWNIRDANDGGYTFENTGLNSIDRFAAVFTPVDGEPVVTYRDPTVFNIEAAVNDEFVIKLQNDNLFWNVEPPVIPTGNVVLRRANGEATERWILFPVQD